MNCNTLWEIIKACADEINDEALNEQKLAYAIEKIRNGYKSRFDHRYVLIRRDLYERMGEPESMDGLEVKVVDNEDAPEMFLL